MLRFGVLGAARIAPPALIAPCASSEFDCVVAVAARDVNRAREFAKRHQIPEVAEDYAALIRRSDINAVYIGLPISLHKYWTMEALKAGKHVLCEKSLALNEAEAKEMAQLARERELILMDAFHYRYHPMFLRAIEIYQSGLLGGIEHIHAEFTVPITDPNDIRLNYATGGGVTMDIGCYPLSWIRHLSGEEPSVISADAVTGASAVDLYLKAELMLAAGVTATAVGDMRESTKFHANVVVRGSAGVLKLINPLAPQLGHRLELQLVSGTKVEKFPLRSSYDYQLDAFREAVTAKQQAITGPVDSIKQMALIDACYSAAGLPKRGEHQGGG